VALAGTRLDAATKGFMAWFGPRGVATMTYSLLVLASGIAVADELFGVAALVVVCSILAHGLTDTAGAEWLARRAEAS
jgi:NhaP-type Na+/H+ or K+/H+ antiporter